MKYAIIIEHISIAYQQTPVIYDLNFSVSTGSLVAIIGPNGSGKTTLLKSIMGLIKPTQGVISIFNQTHTNRSKKIAYIPQRSSVDWTFPATSLDVVIMGLYGRLSFGTRTGNCEKELALQALDKVKMIDFADTPIHQLSGGQQQRLFIARALAQNAEIYLLDEPFIGVDITTETIVFNLLKELQQQNKTVIMVHHDLLTVKKYFDTVLLINKRMIAYGPTDTTMTSLNISKTFPNYINIKTI